MLTRRTLLSAASLGLPVSALAQDNYPSQPIKLIVPHPPGGFTDILARIVAQRLPAALGQPVVVENRGGGGGTIAERSIATATPDGYTLLLTPRDLMIRAELHATKLPYDADKDFAPVSLLAWSPTVIVVNPAFPASTLQELVAYGRREPGRLTYASGGTGTGGHIAMEMLAHDTGMKLVHIPYKGPGQALNDVLGGQVPLTLLQVAVALPHIKAGKLRAIAVPGARRLPSLPEVPTIAETMVPGFDVTPWFGIMAPAATPRPILQKLSSELHRTMQSAEVRTELARSSAEPVGNTPDEFAALIRAETPKWRQIVREGKIRAE